MRVDPQGSDFYPFVLALGYAAIGRFSDAVAALKQHLTRYPNNMNAHLVLAMCHAETGQKQ
jgi:Tfp pilus assembly protein PilF